MEELNNVKGKGLLIHHWDTDGICSAKLLIETLKEKIVVNKTPTLGNYFLTDDELQQCKGFDFIIVADMSLPEDNIKTLAEDAEVFIFDHHLGKVIKEVFHYNPVIKGENPDDYPSASWIVNDYLNNPVNLYALLGIIGDHEQKIKNNQKFYDLINKFCEQNNLVFDDLLQMAYLLDTSYKMGDKTAVEQAPHVLLKVTSPNEILNNHTWSNNLTMLNNEIKKQIDAPSDEIDGIIMKKINTTYNIISTVTRRIAWGSGKNTIVVNTGFFNDKDQIYLRSLKDAQPIIQRGKDLGFKCGGKKEVLGAIVPKEKTDFFITEILDFLNKK
jgi:single-stranded DNA-specific DHH superfamily exonuclease